MSQERESSGNSLPREQEELDKIIQEKTALAAHFRRLAHDQLSGETSIENITIASNFLREGIERLLDIAWIKAMQTEDISNATILKVIEKKENETNLERNP